MISHTCYDSFIYIHGLSISKTQINLATLPQRMIGVLKKKEEKQSMQRNIHLTPAVREHRLLTRVKGVRTGQNPLTPAPISVLLKGDLFYGLQSRDRIWEDRECWSRAVWRRCSSYLRAQQHDQLHHRAAGLHAHQTCRERGDRASSKPACRQSPRGTLLCTPRTQRPVYQEHVEPTVHGSRGRPPQLPNARNAAKPTFYVPSFSKHLKKILF